MIEEEFYKRKAAEYRSARDLVKTKLNATDQAEDNFYFTIDKLLQLAQKSPELLKRSEMEHRRRLINLVLQNLTVKDRQLRWEYRKPFDILSRTAKINSWLGIRFIERELYNKTINKASIMKIRRLFLDK